MVMPISLASAAAQPSTTAAATSSQCRHQPKGAAAVLAAPEQRPPSASDAAAMYASSAGMARQAPSSSACPTTPATASVCTGCEANSSAANSGSSTGMGRPAAAAGAAPRGSCRALARRRASAYTRAVAAAWASTLHRWKVRGSMPRLLLPCTPSASHCRSCSARRAACNPGGRSDGKQAWGAVRQAGRQAEGGRLVPSSCGLRAQLQLQQGQRYPTRPPTTHLPRVPARHGAAGGRTAR